VWYACPAGTSVVTTVGVSRRIEQRVDRVGVNWGRLLEDTSIIV